MAQYSLSMFFFISLSSLSKKEKQIVENSILYCDSVTSFSNVRLSSWLSRQLQFSRESKTSRQSFFRGIIELTKIKFITEASLLRNYFTFFFNFISIGEEWKKKLRVPRHWRLSRVNRVWTFERNI